MGEFRGLEVLKSDAGGLERLCICGLTHKEHLSRLFDPTYFFINDEKDNC